MGVDLNASIASTSKALRAGEISVGELVDATLLQLDRTEHLVHAFAHVLRDEARDAAATLDNELARGECRGPLHGLPVGVKDNIFVAGAPLHAGSESLHGFHSAYDAEVVQRLRDAGAIIIGKTVTHELALAPDRGDGPQPRNPWSTDHSPGGSSAGSGIAPVVRSSFASIGTDTAGSVRGPATWCGAVGLKPTLGSIGRNGVVPLSSSLDHVGIISRTAEDCAAVFEAVTRTGAVVHPQADGARGLSAPLRVGVSPAFGFEAWPEAEVLETVSAAVELLRDTLGVEIVEIDTACLEPAVPVGLTIIMAESCAQYRTRVARTPHRFSPTNRTLLRLADSIPAWAYAAALEWRHRLRDLMRQLFDTHNLQMIVSPTYPIPPTLVDQDAENQHDAARGLPDLVRCTLPANVTGQPAVSIPCGFTSKGLPIGMHLLGRPHQESALLSLAIAYESETQWNDRQPGLLQQIGSMS